MGLFEDALGVIGAGIQIFENVQKTFFKASSSNAPLQTRGGAMDGVGTRTPRNLKSYQPALAGPDSELAYDLPDARVKCRDLYFNTTDGKNTVDTTIDYVVGKGLRPQVAMDWEVITEYLTAYLKWEPKQIENYRERINKKIMRRWRKWSESKSADIQGQHNFPTIQRLTLKSMLHSGEVFPVINHCKHKGKVKVQIGLIETDRVANPMKNFTENNVDGLICDDKGKPIAINVRCSRENVSGFEYKLIPFEYSNGRPAVLHLFEPDRPGQHRGVPQLTSIIERIKNLDTLVKNELNAGKLNSFLALLIESGDPQFLESLSEEQRRNYLDYFTDPANKPNEIAMESGTMMQMMPGEKAVPFDPKRPNTAYGPFARDMRSEISMAMGIPNNMYRKEFSSSYSAARGEMNMYKKPVSYKAQFMELGFCATVWREWMIDEVLSDEIDLVGFFHSEDLMDAYCGSVWSHEPIGQIDETKEADASEKRTDLGQSTMAEETAAMTGNDYETTLEQLAREKALRFKLGIPTEKDMKQDEFMRRLEAEELKKKAEALKNADTTSTPST